MENEDFSSAGVPSVDIFMQIFPTAFLLKLKLKPTNFVPTVRVSRMPVLPSCQRRLQSVEISWNL